MVSECLRYHSLSNVFFQFHYLSYLVLFVPSNLYVCPLAIFCTVCLFLLPCFPFTPNITKWWEEPVFLWVPDSIDGTGPGFSVDSGFYRRPGRGCFSVGEFLFHRVIEGGNSWLFEFYSATKKKYANQCKTTKKKSQ